MANEYKRLVAFWPSVTEVTEQDVSSPYRHRHEKSLTGLLLDDTDTSLLPVYVFKTKTCYIRCTKAHGEPDAYHCVIPEVFRRKRIRINGPDQGNFFFGKSTYNGYPRCRSCWQCFEQEWIFNQPLFIKIDDELRMRQLYAAFPSGVL